MRSNYQTGARIGSVKPTYICRLVILASGERQTNRSRHRHVTILTGNVGIHGGNSGARESRRHYR